MYKKKYHRVDLFLFIESIEVLKKTSLFLLILLISTSCVETRERGFYFGDNIEKVKNFDVYNFTKDDLINNFGHPILELVDGSWLYYSYSTRNLKILKPKLEKEWVLVVSFNKNDEIVDHFYKELNNKKTIDNTDIEDEEKTNFFKALFKGLIITPVN